MRLLATIRLAVRALQRNKLRSLLTMLGIIIGVGSVIAAVSITSGATKQVENQVSALGQNVVLVTPGSFTTGGARGGWGGVTTLKVEDAYAILKEVANVVAVSPEIHTRDQVLANGLNWNTMIMGESPDFPQIRNWGISAGAMFTEQDVRSVAKVAVIGQTVADQLFPNEDALGEIIRIRDIPFKIVGILAAKGFNLFGQDQDDTVVIPYTSHMKRVSRRTYVSSILVQVDKAKDVNKVQSDITDLLKSRHRSLEPDFTVRTQLELAQLATSASKTMSVLLAAIASISLVVGGIGIMNIMLVSVTERTREIGIRMAVGARANDVLVQFLVEAVTLSVFGGLVGVALGVGAANVIASIKDLPVLTPLIWIGVASISSAIVGIISGFYPAWKASQLDPIDALRYE